MLRKLRRSSGRMTLVLVGISVLAACGKSEEMRRDVYASREDCLADWGNKPEDCTPATEQRHAGRGFFYGPYYGYHSGGSGSSWSRSSSSSSRSIGSTSSHSSSGVSRGGFGSSSRSSSSS